MRSFMVYPSLGVACCWPERFVSFTAFWLRIFSGVGAGICWGCSLDNWWFKTLILSNAVLVSVGVFFRLWKPNLRDKAVFLSEMAGDIAALAIPESSNEVLWLDRFEWTVELDTLDKVGDRDPEVSGADGCFPPVVVFGWLLPAPSWRVANGVDFSWHISVLTRSTTGSVVRTLPLSWLLLDSWHLGGIFESKLPLKRGKFESRGIFPLESVTLFSGILCGRCRWIPAVGRRNFDRSPVAELQLAELSPESLWLTAPLTLLDSQVKIGSLIDDETRHLVGIGYLSIAAYKKKSTTSTHIDWSHTQEYTRHTKYNNIASCFSITWLATTGLTCISFNYKFDYLDWVFRSKFHLKIQRRVLPTDWRTSMGSIGKGAFLHDNAHAQVTSKAVN